LFPFYNKEDFDGQHNTQTNQPYTQADGANLHSGTNTFDRSYNP